MTYPKIRPCPQCGKHDVLAVYRYDNGWRHVECDACFYFGPGAGNQMQAIRAHNAHCIAIDATAPPGAP